MAVRTFISPTPLEETLLSRAPTSHPDPPPASAKPAAQHCTGVPPPASRKSAMGVTFDHQDKLPKLPIPDLKQTCERYLDSLKPLQTPREHEESKASIEDFLRADGPELNERLKKYATGRTSYIEQFCKANPLAVNPAC